MLKPFRQFFVMTWVIVISVFIAWNFARHRGLDAPVKPPLAHAFLESQSFEVIARPPSDWRPQQGWTFHDRAAALGKDVILWIDVRPTLRGALVVARDDADANSAPPLSEALERFKQNRLILCFRGYREGIKEEFLRVLDGSPGVMERALVQSPEDGFLKDLREARPTWIFGTSLAQITRLIMLSSIGLESQSPIRGDAVIADEPAVLPRLSDRDLAEIHRRGRKFFVGPVSSVEQAAQWRTRGFDGVITDQPEALIATRLH